MYTIIFSLMVLLENVLSAEVRDSRHLITVESKSNSLTISSKRRESNKTLLNHPEQMTIRKRKRRYDYEDVSDWDYDNANFDYEDETVSKWKKYALNWEKVGLRLIYMGSTIIMITCCVCFCCRKCCSVICDTCCHFVHRCTDRCRCRDPMYRQIKTFCDQAGIKMDYKTFLELKEGINEALAAQGFNRKI